MDVWAADELAMEIQAEGMSGAIIGSRCVPAVVTADTKHASTTGGGNTIMIWRHQEVLMIFRLRHPVPAPVTAEF